MIIHTVLAVTHSFLLWAPASTDQRLTVDQYTLCSFASGRKVDVKVGSRHSVPTHLRCAVNNYIYLSCRGMSNQICKEEYSYHLW